MPGSPVSCLLSALRSSNTVPESVIGSGVCCIDARTAGGEHRLGRGGGGMSVVKIADELS